MSSQMLARDGKQNVVDNAFYSSGVNFQTLLTEALYTVIGLSVH